MQHASMIKNRSKSVKIETISALKTQNFFARCARGKKNRQFGAIVKSLCSKLAFAESPGLAFK